MVIWAQTIVNFPGTIAKEITVEKIKCCRQNSTSFNGPDIDYLNKTTGKYYVKNLLDASAFKQTRQNG